MQLRTVLLVILALKSATAVSKSTTPAPQTSSTITTQFPLPTIEYSCSQTDIVIKLADIKSKFYNRVSINKDPTFEKLTSRLALTTNSSRKCDAGYVNITSLSNITLKECPIGSPVYLYIMADHLTESVPLIGGRKFHRYAIECSLPAHGITGTVKAGFIATALPTMTNTTNHTLNLTASMTISPSASVKIGQPLKLQIQIVQGINPTDQIYILPDTCFGLNNKNQSEKVKLLSDGKSKDTDILENFIIQGTSASANLFAFEFIGSKSVGVSCTVHICPDLSCDNTFTAYTPTPSATSTTMTSTKTANPVGRRKRRAIVTEENGFHRITRKVEASFTVKGEVVASDTPRVMYDLGMTVTCLVLASIVRGNF